MNSVKINFAGILMFAFTFQVANPGAMFRKSFLSLFLLLNSFMAAGIEAHSPSFTDRMLQQIEAPVLDAFTHAAAAGGSAATTFAPLWQASPARTPSAPDMHPDYSPYDIPQIRRYQNSHKAPVRFYSGAGAVTLGGAMLIAGYRQDTKYPWSGPYMSLSPLNVFGVLMVIVGLGLILSGWIYYSKYKKHVIAPYHKSY